MAKKLTAEQQEEKRQQAAAAEFERAAKGYRAQYLKARAQHVAVEPYDVLRLSATVDGPLFGKEDMAGILYDALSRFDQARRDFRSGCERLQENMERTLQQVADGHYYSASSGPVQSRGVDVDVAYAVMTTAAGTAAQLSRAAGVFCPMLYGQQANDKRALMLAHSVQAVTEGYVVVAPDGVASGRFGTELEAYAKLAEVMGDTLSHYAQFAPVGTPGHHHHTAAGR
jgi:hypothetical protein